MKKHHFSKHLLALLVASTLTISPLGKIPTLAASRQSTSFSFVPDSNLTMNLSTQASESITIEKIDHYDSANAIRGVDVSSYLSLMDSYEEVNSGITEDSKKIGFHDFEGNLLDKQGFFNLLADSGINYVRLRVWNQPYTNTGNGYGGGNNDLNKAIEMGTYASNAGMKILIDFHFSDFWADPAKQQAPKEWNSYSLSQKESAISDYITNALNQLKSAGVNVGMVQIGNETNAGFCGETEWTNMNRLFDAGCDAVHNFNNSNGTSILAALHFTNPERSGMYTYVASNLANYDGNSDGFAEGVSYDVFASSYYPYWHGTMENLTSVLSEIASSYDKYVMVAETSWANTFEDGDGHPNTISSEDDLGSYVNYDISVQGQATEIRDVCEAVNNVQTTLTNGNSAALGAFYWEPAWLPVSYVYNEDGSFNNDTYETNKKLWEKYGSGWASSYSGEYDSSDAGLYYGGSAVDNQALFDFNGYPLASLNVFNQLDYGTTISSEQNLLSNTGFEAQGNSWTLSGSGAEIKERYDDAKSGNYCTHFWSDSDFAFTLSQTVQIREDGLYNAYMFIQGGYDSEDTLSESNRFYLSVTDNEGNIYTSNNMTLNGWRNWQQASISSIPLKSGQTVTLTFHVDAQANAWGSIDDAGLYRVSDLPETEHTYGDWKTISEPTCTLNGTAQRTCSGCGNTETTEIPATGHTLSENSWTTTKEPNCTDTGEATRYCSDCDYFETKELPATGHHINSDTWEQDADLHWHTCTSCSEKFDSTTHTMEWIVDVPATESATGTRHEECSVCGYIGNTEEIPANHSHDYDSAWITNETSHWHKCECGETADLDVHTFSKWQTIQDASCESDGIELRKCKVCDFEETRTIPATGHTLSEDSWITTKEPDCTDAGEATRYCSDCDYFETKELPATGHHISSDTWEQDADLHWHTCTSCNEKFDSATHTMKWIVDIPVTGNAAGSRHEECSVCGYIGNTEEIPLNHIHDYETKWKTDESCHWHECSTCAEKTDLESHTFSAWQMIKEPTCVTTGLELRSCTVCGIDEIREITATGHNPDSSLWFNNATKHWHECNTCGEKSDEASHTMSWIIDFAATVYMEGTQHEECTVCGYIGKTETIPKITIEPPTETSTEETTERTTEISTTSSSTEQTTEITTEDLSSERTTQVTTEISFTEGTTEVPSTESTTEVITEVPSTESTTETITEVPSTESTTEVITEVPSTESTTEVITGTPSTEKTTESTTQVPSTEKTTEVSSTEEVSSLPKINDIIKVTTGQQSVTYRITSVATDGTGTVTYEKNNSNTATIQIPAKITIEGITYKVTSIAANAFKNNRKIRNVTIGNNVTVIGKNAFYKCSNLKKITIGANVTTIQKNAFYKCSSLKNIKIKSKKLKTIGKNAIKGIHKKAVIQVPKTKKAAYKKLFKKKTGFKQTMKFRS